MLKCFLQLFSVAVVIQLESKEQHSSSKTLYNSALFFHNQNHKTIYEYLIQRNISKMEFAFLFSFLFLMMTTVVHGTEYPWTRSSVQHQPYRRMALTPYNERLDAKEWLDQLLASLTSDEPVFSGVNEPVQHHDTRPMLRSPTPQSPQRIFQREARPSLTFVQNHPTGKRRFSLASVRVNPASLKRQHIFAAPNMALLELENPARIPNRINPPNFRPANVARPVQQVQQQRPRENQWQHFPSFRQQQQQQPSPYEQTYQEQQEDYPGNVELNFENPAVAGSTPLERYLDVDIHVNHYDD